MWISLQVFHDYIMRQLYMWILLCACTRGYYYIVSYLFAHILLLTMNFTSWSHMTQAFHTTMMLLAENHGTYQHSNMPPHHVFYMCTHAHTSSNIISTYQHSNMSTYQVFLHVYRRTLLNMYSTTQTLSFEH